MTSSCNRNSYVSLKDYNKTIIQEKFVNSEYIKQSSSYPKNIKVENPEILSNYNSSGAVTTNPVYNVAEQAPGLSWI